MAEVLGRLGARPHLLAIVGNDGDGSNMLSHASAAGVQTEGTMLRSSRGQGTSTYMAILDEKGDLFTTIADMGACDEIEPETHLPNEATLASAPIVLVDGNVSERFISALAFRCAKVNVPLLFEPTSIEKCVRCVPALLANQLTFLSPSAAELLALSDRVAAEESARKAGQPFSVSAAVAGFLHQARDSFEHNRSTAAVEAQCRSILSAVASRALAESRPLKPFHLILKRGAVGALIASLLPIGGGEHDIRMVHLSAGTIPTPPGLVNTSGAGDTLVGATAWALLASGKPSAVRGEDEAELIQAVQLGMRAAEMTLAAEQSVSPLLAAHVLRERQRQYVEGQKEKALDIAHATR